MKLMKGMKSFWVSDGPKNQEVFMGFMPFMVSPD